MKLGTLNFPASYSDYSASFNFGKPYLSQHIRSIGRRLPEAEERKQSIEADPRLQDYINPFEIGEHKVLRLQSLSLLDWWIWRANSTDIETADGELEKFISSIEGEHSHMAALWVHGLACDKTISLWEDVQVTPLTEMPLSEDKIRFSEPTIGLNVFESKPTAALTSDFKASVVDQSGASKKSSEKSHALKEIAAVLNCLAGCTCVPAFSTSYAHDHVPPGHWGGSGGQYWTEQALPRTNYDPQEAGTLELAAELIACFRQLPPAYKHQFHAALTRLSQAKSTNDRQKMALDLGIALEMLLLFSENKKERPDQLSLSYRLRGAWIAGDTLEERRSIYDTLNTIYSHRSQVAHNGKIDHKNKTPHEIRALQNKQIEVAEKVFQRLLLLGSPPNWKEVTLGANL